VAELTRESALAVKQLAVHYNSDRHAAAQVQVENILAVLRTSGIVLGVAAGARVVLEQRADACDHLEDIGQLFLVTGEVFVAAPGVGVDSTRYADSKSQNPVAIDAACVDETGNRITDVFETGFSVFEPEACLFTCDYDVVLYVGNYKLYVVAAYVDSGEIYGATRQAIDIRSSAPGRFDLAVLVHEAVVDQLSDEFRHGGDADVEGHGEFGDRGRAARRHVGDYIPLNEVVFVDDTFLQFVFVLMKKFL
jgi:hypothetical protein